MYRARAVAVVILLLSYGAVGARQPAVRAALPLPVSARAIADAAGLSSADPSTLLIHIVRRAFDSPVGENAEDREIQTALRTVLWTPAEKTTDVVPLPLDPSIWRETLLQQKVTDQQIVAAILADRRAALMYYGLSALDDATLGWLGPDRDTLLHLRERPGLFGAFGRSIHVRAGHVVVPGGVEAEPLWEALTGVPPTKPAAFVQRLFSDTDGWLPFLYDTVAHLDAPRQRFALGLQLPASSRADRLRAMLDACASVANAWRPERHPFSRPPLDPSMLLSTVSVTTKGDAAGPMGRRIWEQVFRGDESLDVEFTGVASEDIQRDDGTLPIDAAWLALRIARVPYTLGRRRLDTLLFAQRVFPDSHPEDPASVATALRGFTAFPSLMLALERIGAVDTPALVRAAEHAKALDEIRSDAIRHTSIAQFQSVIGLIDRAHRSGTLTDSSAHLLLGSLMSLEVSPERGYEGRMTRWVKSRLVRALPAVAGQEDRPAESAVLSAMAGVMASKQPGPVVEWEGRRYRVDPADAEFRRLLDVRRHQGGQTLDGALAAALDADDHPRKSSPAGRSEAERHVADTLVSMLYAAYLGDPDGQAVAAGNVALRHDFGFSNARSGPRAAGAWRLPAEDFSARGGWRIRGSLLGLETALGRLALKRIDPNDMPIPPKLTVTERQMAALTVALLNPFAMSDAARDEIAAALGRGRARAANLGGDSAELDAVARSAGLSEWRRQALAWTLTHNRSAVLSQFSLLELFWLGAPRPAALRSLDAWGAAALPLTGCLCLNMPAARPWEEMTGRPSTGVLASRAADVALQVADALASLQLPARLAPFVLGFAMQEVTDNARPGYPEDWDEFGRAAIELPRGRLTDYVAALTAGGPLVPADPEPQQR